MSASGCPHPCRFRLSRSIDRGWGELAFEYVWDSTSGEREPEGTLPDLAACFLYEFTTYGGNAGKRDGDRLIPPCPPFDGWTFRDPTDGRIGQVGMERFAASQGWAWDRHKLGGTLLVGLDSARYEIVAMQEYRFHCERCGIEAVVSGPDSGPHPIVRTVSSVSLDKAAPNPIWRYGITKQGVTAWLDWNASGYVGDSAGIGFGPLW